MFCSCQFSKNWALFSATKWYRCFGEGLEPDFTSKLGSKCLTEATRWSMTLVLLRFLKCDWTTLESNLLTIHTHMLLTSKLSTAVSCQSESSSTSVLLESSVQWFLCLCLGWGVVLPATFFFPMLQHTFSEWSDFLIFDICDSFQHILFSCGPCGCHNTHLDSNVL